MVDKLNMQLSFLHSCSVLFTAQKSWNQLVPVPHPPLSLPRPFLFRFCGVLVWAFVKQPDPASISQESRLAKANQQKILAKATHSNSNWLFWDKNRFYSLIGLRELNYPFIFLGLREILTRYFTWTNWGL